MKQLKYVWYLAVKDLKLFASDPLALFFAIAFPFMFVIMFNFLMKGVGSQDPRLVLDIVTREQAGMSQQIISSMVTEDPATLKPGQPQIVWLKDYAQANQDVADKKLGGFIAFPESFTEAVSMGYGCKLEVVYNPSNTVQAAALKSLAQSIAVSVGAQHVVSESVLGLLLEQDLQSPGSAGDLSQAIRGVVAGPPAQQQPPLITFDVQKLGDVKAVNPSNFVIPGYLVMFVFMTASFAAQQIVRERQNRTLERLMATSATRAAVLGGVFTGTTAKGLVQLVIFWGMGIFVFKMDLGVAPGAVFLLSLLVVFMATAFGVMLATLVKTEKSANSIGVLASLILAPLGGCWWPLFVTPHWMQFLAKFTPHGWATDGFNKLLVFGGNFSSVTPDLLMLVVFGLLFGVIAIARFRTEGD